MALYRLMMSVMLSDKLVGVSQVQRDEARINPGR